MMTTVGKTKYNLTDMREESMEIVGGKLVGK